MRILRYGGFVCLRALLEQEPGTLEGPSFPSWHPMFTISTKKVICDER